MRRPRDTQRSKLYQWERETFGLREARAPVTLREVEHLLGRIARHYKVSRVPAVLDGRGRNSPGWSPHRYAVQLPRQARTRADALHEAAHWLVDCLYWGREPAWHGPEFLGVLMYLLVKYGEADRTHLARTANEARLDFASARACGPR
jgi:hypothetical protein